MGVKSGKEETNDCYSFFRQLMHVVKVGNGGMIYSASFVLRRQDPIQINDCIEPQPDLALLKFQPDFYGDRRPRAEDVLLIIEVADSSYAYNRQIKNPPLRPIWYYRRVASGSKSSTVGAIYATARE
jgi:hypothetical protein